MRYWADPAVRTFDQASEALVDLLATTSGLHARARPQGPGACRREGVERAHRRAGQCAGLLHPGAGHRAPPGELSQRLDSPDIVARMNPVMRNASRSARYHRDILETFDYVLAIAEK